MGILGSTIVKCFLTSKLYFRLTKKFSVDLAFGKFSKREMFYNILFTKIIFISNFESIQRYFALKSDQNVKKFITHCFSRKFGKL